MLPPKKIQYICPFIYLNNCKTVDLPLINKTITNYFFYHFLSYYRDKFVTITQCQLFDLVLVALW